MAELFYDPLFSSANLVSYWRLGGNSTDAKGSNNGSDTTITYGTSNGKFGQGAGFNGSSSNIIVGTGLNATMASSAWTISLWVNPTSLSALQFFIANDNNSGTRQFVAGVGADGKTYFEKGGSGIISGTGASLITGWNHVAFLYNGTKFKSYVNGVFAADATDTALAATANNLYFGQRQYSGDERYYGGKMDDVSIFNSALTDDEILRLSRIAGGAFILNFV